MASLCFFRPRGCSSHQSTNERYLKRLRISPSTRLLGAKTQTGRLRETGWDAARQPALWIIVRATPEISLDLNTLSPLDTV